MRKKDLRTTKKKNRFGLIVKKYCEAHDCCKGCKFDHEGSWCFKDHSAYTIPLEELEAALKEIS